MNIRLQIMRRIALIKMIIRAQIYKNEYTMKISLCKALWQLLARNDGKRYWPVHSSSKVGDAAKIKPGVDVCPGYSPGCYIQTQGYITIGDYTKIAPNVGIITGNHDVYDVNTHTEPQDVVIGDYCWIGMNAVILPGVSLGDFTTVAAGAVVTKSFEGYAVIGGAPAKVIKNLDKHKCVRSRNEKEFVGYVANKDVQKFRKKFIEKN